MYRNGLKFLRAKEKRSFTEHESMIRFYEPINKAKIMKQWLKKPKK